MVVTESASREVLDALVVYYRGESVAETDAIRLVGTLETMELV